MRLPVSLPSKFVSPEVDAVVSAFSGLTRNNRRYTYREMENCVVQNPMVAASLNARIFMTIGAMGSYSHPDDAIQDEVRRAIASMQGTWVDKLAEVMSYIPYGFSVTEKRYTNFGGKATIAGMRTLDQSRCRFEGEARIERVGYPKVDRTEGTIDYAAVIHVRNESHLLLNSTNPMGLPTLERVVPLNDLYNLLLVALSIACQRQATPIVVQKTDLASMSVMLDATGKPLLDSSGKPVLVKAGEQAREQLENLQNGSVMVIDRMDDVIALAQQTDGKLLLQAIDLVLGMMSLAVLVPRSLQLTNAGGVGDATLADAQFKVFMQILAHEITKLSDALVTGLIQPMLMWNYGKLETYGSFPMQQEKATDAAQKITAISNAIASGTVTTQDAIDRFNQYVEAAIAP